MKRIYNFMLLFLASAALVLTGCKKEEIIFEHEQPQFETKADAILLEVIMPNGTAADEQLFITGAFNGEQKYQLEKAEKSDKKWGIYLYESDFVEGKTLMDGFYFVSATNGAERTAKGDTVTHTLNAAYGTRTNVWVASWEAFFKGGDEPIKHDGYVVYVLDETGWDALAMYAWGDAEAFGGWPGIAPTGKETIKGVEYIYFDCGEDNTGLSLNLIFNNNGGGTQLGDFGFVVERNVFLKLTASGAEEFTPSDEDVFPTIKHDGQDIVFVADDAEWGIMTLYMWGDVNNLDRDGGESAGWPGLDADGDFEFAGYHWYYFLMGAVNEGKNENMIFNNHDGGSQTGDVNVTFGAGEVYYYVVTADKKATQIEDPNELRKDDPEDNPTGHDTIIVTVKDTITTQIYFIKDTENKPNVYVWGTAELFGGWPGTAWTAWEKTTFFGQELYHYEFDAVYGDSYNFIINGEGDGNQYDAFNVSVGAKTELFYMIQDDKAVEITPTVEQVSVIRRSFRK